MRKLFPNRLQKIIKTGKDPLRGLISQFRSLVPIQKGRQGDMSVILAPEKQKRQTPGAS